MADLWLDDIIKRKVVTIFRDDSVSGNPKWNKAFDDAVQKFNDLSSALALGVRLSSSGTPPSEKGLDGADVRIAAASGKVSFTVLGNTFDQDSDGNDLFVIGTGTEGLTLLPVFPLKEGPRIVKGRIFVPTAPSVTAKGRLVGDQVWFFIALHELVHLTGLTNKDHSPEAIPDVFVVSPSFSEGKTTGPDGKLHSDPTQDKLVLKSGQLQANGSFIPAVTAPPTFTLSARTAGLIKKIWSP